MGAMNGGRLYYWVANWNLARAQAARLLGNDVTDMVDCTHSALPRVRQCLEVIKVIGGYITGTSDIRWTPEDFTSIPDDVTVLSVDQSDLDLPLLSNVKRVVKDVERGASTISQAVHVAKQRITRGDDYIVYVSQGDLSALEGAMRHAGLPHGEIIAYQWASDTSNPHTILPGTRLTLREANCDLSVIRKDVLAQLHPSPSNRRSHPHPTPSSHGEGSHLLRAHVGMAITYDPVNKKWKIEHATIA